MIRWWTYAIVAVALVCGGTVRARPAVATRAHHELRTSSPVQVSACKRTSKPVRATRRSDHDQGPLAVPARPTVAPRLRVWSHEHARLVAARTDAPAVAATARAPPGT